MKPIARQIVILALLSALSQAQTFSIDFRNGIWDHSSVGGPSNSVGWAKTLMANPTSTRGYLAGRTEVQPGVFLDVNTQFLGTAKTGPDNFILDPVNTPGFGFQNAGTGDKNTLDGSGLTILNNYQRIDFTFSKKVSLDFLQIGDIDTASSSGNQAWRDTVGLELWNGSVPITPGSGINPSISTPGTIAEPTRLLMSTTTGGLPFAYANTLGNTSYTANPISPTNPSSAIFFYDATPVDGFSIYFWNRGLATGGQHAVVLQAAGNFLTVVPEPSSALLCSIGAISLLLRRQRS